MMARCCTFADVAPLADAAAQERIFLADDPATTWFCVELAGQVVSIGGLRRMGHGHFRLVSAFTRPAYRGAGYGRLVREARLAHALAVGAWVLDTFSRHPRAYLEAGFMPTGERSIFGTELLRWDVLAQSVGAVEQVCAA